MTHCLSLQDSGAAESTHAHTAEKMKSLSALLYMHRGWRVLQMRRPSEIAKAVSTSPFRDFYFKTFAALKDD